MVRDEKKRGNHRLSNKSDSSKTVLSADDMIYSTASRVTMLVPNPRDLEWTAGAISREPVKTNAERE